LDQPFEEPRPDRLRLRVGGRPWATWLLLALNVAAFGWTLLRGGGLFDVNADVAIRLGANHGPSFAQGQWWRALTSTFLHGGILHLVFNMWGLRVLGPFLEAVLGGTAFLIVYLLSGVGASLASMAVHPGGVSLGASGSIFALLGAHVAFFLRHRREMPDPLFRGQMRTMLMLIAINVALGLSIPQIDNSAHLGGLVLGFAGGFLLDRPLLAEPRMTPRRWNGALLLALLLVPGAMAALRRAGSAPAGGTSLTMARAKEALERSDWPAANAIAEEMLAAGEDTANAHLVRAIVRMEQDAWDGALADADAILEREPGFAPAIWIRTQSLYRLSRWADAAQAADALAESGEAEGEILRWLCRVRLGERARADRDLKAWLRSRTAGGSAFERLAGAHFAEELPLADFEREARAADDDPRSGAARALSLAGERLAALGDEPGAAALFRRALDQGLPPGSSTELDLAAQRLRERGDAPK
jgi:membrane associated rhomboid family serine protease